MSKNSFIVYHDQAEVFKELTDEEAGQLIKAMVSYSITNKEPKLDRVLRLLFIPIKQQMDRNTLKYEETCDKNKDNINKRWHKLPNDTTVYDRIRPDTKHTDKDKDKDKDKDSLSFENLNPLLTDKHIAKIAADFDIMGYEVRRVWTKMLNSRIANGRPYVNWISGLRTWIQGEIDDGKIRKQGAV